MLRDAVVPRQPGQGRLWQFRQGLLHRVNFGVVEQQRREIRFWKETVVDLTFLATQARGFSLPPGGRVSSELIRRAYVVRNTMIIKGLQRHVATLSRNVKDRVYASYLTRRFPSISVKSGTYRIAAGFWRKGNYSS